MNKRTTLNKTDTLTIIKDVSRLASSIIGSVVSYSTCPTPNPHMWLARELRHYAWHLNHLADKLHTEKTK